MNKSILDIDDLNDEWIKINNNLDAIWYNLVAIAFNYRQYINNSLTDNDIIEFRDNLDYRFFSIRLHAELLTEKQHEIENRIKALLKNDSGKILGQYFPSNPYLDIFQKEISAIFDSFLYHLVSIFDYVALLINYICGESSSKMNPLKWTQLARCARDPKNYLGRKEIAKIINEVDRNFVLKLYDYRSLLIHRKSDLSGYSFSIQLIGDDKFSMNYFATKRILNQFSELKIMAKDNNISLKYVLFWLAGKTFEKFTDLVNGLKMEIETFPTRQMPMFYVYDKESNRVLPASMVYRK